MTSPSRDRAILSAAGFLRSLAVSGLGIALGIYLAEAGLSASRIGLIVGAGLAGGAFYALIITLFGERLPKRASLISLAILTLLGSLSLIWFRSEILLLAASFFGMVNGMGRDRGAALILEQALIPQTVGDAGRTKAFAWYNVLQDAGHMLGGLLVALPLLLVWLGFEKSGGNQLIIILCAAFSGISALLYLFLSPASSLPSSPKPAPVSPETKKIVAKISGLFLLDSIGGGFLTTALVSYFFFERFNVGIAQVGLLFAAARGLNAVSHLGAAWLARKIGLVNTMVFTHIPSSLFLASVAIAPSFPVAAILFLLREGLVEMDVPTRQSYVMAVVKPGERTFASGATGLVRMGGWAVAPSFAGLFMQSVASAAPLIAGAGLKIIYDVLLYLSFRKLPPPEER